MGPVAPTCLSKPKLVSTVQDAKLLHQVACCFTSVTSVCLSLWFVDLTMSTPNKIMQNLLFD
jgi:hypothetical protein